jgi:regulator of extracellular matrix RemA (YlzA/DUF370 family)
MDHSALSQLRVRSNTARIGALADVSMADKVVLLGAGLSVGAIAATLIVNASRKKEESSLLGNTYAQRTKANILADAQHDFYERTGDEYHKEKAEFWKGEADASWKLEERLRGLK